MSNVLRSMRRSRAKRAMRSMGEKKFCKHDIIQHRSISGKEGEKEREPSLFSERWREFTNHVVI